MIRAKAGGVLEASCCLPLGWRRVQSVAIPARPYLGVSDQDREDIVDQGDLFIRRPLA